MPFYEIFNLEHVKKLLKMLKIVAQYPQSVQEHPEITFEKVIFARVRAVFLTSELTFCMGFAN